MSVLVVYIVIIYQVFTCRLKNFIPIVKTSKQPLYKKGGGELQMAYRFILDSTNRK